MLLEAMEDLLSPVIVILDSTQIGTNLQCVLMSYYCSTVQIAEANVLIA